MLHLLKHQWYEMTRSAFWQKTLVVNILMGFFILYIMANLVVLGYFGDFIIKETAGDQVDVVKYGTKLLFYYFLGDLMLRFLLQQIPTLSIRSYLTLPIKKSLLLHYPLIKSFFHYFNVQPLLIVLPFYFKVVYAEQSFSFAMSWLIVFLSLIVINNFLHFVLKKYFAVQSIWVIALLVCVGVFFYLDFTQVISVSDFFVDAYYWVCGALYRSVLPVAAGICSYLLAYNLLKRNTYVEDIVASKDREVRRLSFLDDYGKVGQLLKVELKLILRNKRPRSLMILGGLFFFYGFYFYGQRHVDSHIMLSLAGLMVPGMFAINYGQLTFSWDSAFFDGYMTHNVSPDTYVKSKYLLLGISFFVGYLVTLPYAFMNYKIALINTAFLLYNIGCSSVLLLYLCTYNAKRIDLGKGQMMNYEGIGAAQYLLIIPYVGIPLLVYFLMSFIGSVSYYYIAICMLGMVSIMLHKFLLNKLTNQFLSRKYIMSAGFRKK